MNSADIRKSFLDYFAGHGHKVLPSSPLVPGNDPTLLFTNSGMVQFKDVFLGREARPYKRAVTSQRCLRAGGKHNDLENVGYTARHHTFFEMLGNFSFGDYFKREAIRYAWEFLTVNLGLPPEKLWVTVFRDDDEAADIWLNEIKAPPERFSRMGEKDNFWAMGDTGPCGPCSEVFYDHGPEVAGGPPGSPDEDGDRYIEIWNLVFMQFERKDDGSLEPLPRPSVDTGAGLERIAAVMQQVHSNYQIDLFQSLLKDIRDITGAGDLEDPSMRVIADHIRSCAFLVADGVLPSNEGRGYVLRRIVRRAIRHGHRLGVKDLFFHKLVQSLANVMGEAYPELVEQRSRIENVLLEEERQFARTLENGMTILEKAIAELDGKVISGETVFRLYDTYGFPIDLTADVAREHGLTIDSEGFEQAMAAQREQARAASNFNIDFKFDLATPNVTTERASDKHEKTKDTQVQSTEFIGYDQLSGEAQVNGIFDTATGKPLAELSDDREAALLLDVSPFYGESGGQVGDTGVLEIGEMRFLVTDTQKQGESLVHIGKLRQGALRTGDRLEARVAAEERGAITLNHSATHLMNAALRNILGAHVTQQGSLVDKDRLRFDFSHSAPVGPEQIREIERQVNSEILRNSAVSKEIMPIGEARKRGALAMFGEKYGDEVRVVSMGGEYSVEFCGGCHVERTGDIGLFRITSESGISAGVRRIEAVTGGRALELVHHEEQTLRDACRVVKSSPDELVERVSQLTKANRALEKQIEQLKARLATGAGGDLADRARDVAGIKVLATQVDGLDAKAMRDAVDKLKNRLGNKCVVVLAGSEDGKVSLVAGVSKDLTESVKAGDLANMVAGRVGGKGGGRPDMAMAGGRDASALPAALESVTPWVEAQLADAR